MKNTFLLLSLVAILIYTTPVKAALRTALRGATRAITTGTHRRFSGDSTNGADYTGSRVRASWATPAYALAGTLFAGGAVACTQDLHDEEFEAKLLKVQTLGFWVAYLGRYDSSDIDPLLCFDLEKEILYISPKNYLAVLNSHNSEGFTPLIFAICSLKENEVRILLKHGADPDLKTIEDTCSPLEMALGLYGSREYSSEQRHALEIIKVLLSAPTPATVTLEHVAMAEVIGDRELSILLHTHYKKTHNLPRS